MQQVDVVLLTKNSEHLLSKCLSSIYRNVPVKNLIVIDGFSTDRTLQILDKFNEKYGNISLFQMKGSRAKARTEGISRVSTDWFMFVDSDVLLCKDWYKKAQADLASGVGAVWGLNIDVIPNVKDKRILKLQSLIARQCFYLRGGMHDTLILRKAVEGIRIPEQLHAYEDAFIVQWIEKHGYKVSVGSDIYCLHYKPPTNWNLKNGFAQAIVEFKCGLVYSHLYEYMVFYPVFLLYWVLQLPLNGFRNSLTR
ncbi:MAG: glycosyltransferase family 2 protein [Candidatus Bathyarchaeota archaeon]|nr:glycosyltransferase family 2 protein [Candidatus Bathyarchaeota archaeon]